MEILINLKCETVAEAVEEIKKLQKANFGILSVVVEIINPSNYEQ